MSLKALFDTTDADNNLGPIIVAVCIAVAIAMVIIVPFVAVCIAVVFTLFVIIPQIVVLRSKPSG